MRTTLDIDDTVLRAARALAAQTDQSLGAAVSELARRGLGVEAPRIPQGFPTLPRAGGSHVITDELVAEHRDDVA